MATKTKKKNDTNETKDETIKKDSDLVLSRLDVQTHEEREPKELKGGPNNIFTIVTY